MSSGNYVRQSAGYRAFIPAPLPPAIEMDIELVRLLSDADRALGRLDGVSTVLPNPDLFVAMYVRHEAVLSSQIEGTQSTLQDLLEFEAEGKQIKDVHEVVNYVAAMNHGLDRLSELPLSLRLLREIHDRLLRGSRGSEKSPGEFRRTQNWVGSAGSSLNDAEYVPPPPYEMQEALSNLELFLHDRLAFPVLIQCGIAHAQFETIHPFLDGNGRVGRLLITLMLCEREILTSPLLYLSYYLKAHRAQYYDRLMAIRNDNDWVGWLKFFLRGVFEVSQSATQVSRDILSLRELHREAITQKVSSTNNGLKLLDYLFQQPIISVKSAEDYLGCTFSTANSVVNALVDLQVLEEITGRERYRIFRYWPYLKLFDRQALVLPEDSTVRMTSR